MIDWNDWENYLPGFVCRCAKKAKDLGYDLFGVQFFGKCYSYKHPSRVTRLKLPTNWNSKENWTEVMSKPIFDIWLKGEEVAGS